MEPLLRRGDMVIADLDGSPKHGDLVVARRGDEVLVRIYDADAALLRASDERGPLPSAAVDASVPVMGIDKVT